jgi:hypothetical protein
MLFLCCVMPLPAWPADAEGHYAVKGVGNTTCAGFLEARAALSPRYQMYGGWIDGFLSAANLYESDTFDIVAWQNTDLLASLVASRCEPQPDVPFHLAVSRTMQGLFAQRVRSRSDVVGFAGDDGGRGVALYRTVVERMGERLRSLGYVASADVPTEALQAALRAFQADRQLPVTGLPDQVTLLYLLGVEADGRAGDAG